MPSVFVTGSGKRLGKGLALEFAKKNWDVAIHYFSSEDKARENADAIKKLNLKTHLVRADLRSPADINEMFDDIEENFGIPDVVVNNAGIWPPKTEPTELEEDLWNNVIDSNLKSGVFVSKEFARRAAPGSRIVNIASLGALEVWEGRLAYNVSKAGVLQATKSLARDLAPNLSVNAVCPGTVWMPDELKPQDDMFSEQKIPMKRYAKVEDVFDAVYFFASATGYITGQFIAVDGGHSLVKR